MIIEKDLLENSNIPIIPSNFTNQQHKVFIKYSSTDNYKYAYELLNILCNNSKSKNKISLFYKSLKCLFKLIYNLYNNEQLIEYDILILSSFYLGLKLNEIRTKVPKIKKLKEIYPEKYHNYDTNNIREAELICIKLLDYNIDILTSYDCLIKLLYDCNDDNLYNSAFKELETLIKNNFMDFASMPPLEIAEVSIKRAKRMRQYYIHPSILIKEYNKKNNEKHKSSINDNYIQVCSTIKKSKHSNLFSSEKMESASNRIVKNKNLTNSIYNCSFKILRKLSNVNKSIYSNNINSFTELKNSMNFNIKKSIIGKRLYENSIYSTNKKSNLLKSANFSNTCKNKEEKENYSISNFLFNRNKDINCTKNYRRVITVGQKKLFQD